MVQKKLDTTLLTHQWPARRSASVFAAVFESNMSFGSLLSCQIQGNAEVVDLYSREYIAEASFRHISAEMLQKLPSLMWLIRIVPDEMTLLDSSLKKEGYGSRQTWKR